MSAARNVSITFKRQAKTLTVSAPSNGHVSEGSNLNCGDGTGETTCSHDYAHDAAVTLTANPDADYEVDSWGGDCATAGSATTCALTMSAARSASITFKRQAKTLTVSAPSNGHVSEGSNLNCGDGTGETTCSHDYAHDAAVTLTANPDADYEVDAWGGDCATAGSATTCALTMSTARNVSITFKRKAKTLTVTSPSNGHVSEGSNLNCGDDTGETTCSHDYAHDAAVTLTANPNTGYGVDSWGGDCATAGSATTCGLTMSAARSASVTFKQQTKTLTVSPTPSNGSVRSSPGSISCGYSSNGVCSHSYATGTGVSLSATPATNYNLGAWGGACFDAGRSSSCSLTMNADQAVSATFVRNPICGTGGACAPGDASSPPADTLPEHAVCNNPVQDDCTVGTWADGTDTKARNGACGSAPDSCLNNTEVEEAEDTTTHHKWKCLGVAGTRRWRCLGTDGWLNWTCTSGFATTCSEPWFGNDDYCNATIEATDMDCEALKTPPCNLDATTTAEACPSPGTYSDPPADTFVDGVCNEEELGTCETDGEPTDYDTTRVDGVCSKTTPNKCDAGNPKDSDFVNGRYIWTCEGIDGTASWTCPGTDGDWNWTCTNETLSQSCSKAVSGNDASCSADDPAADASCRMEQPVCHPTEFCAPGDLENFVPGNPTNGDCGTAANTCTDGSTPDESPADVAAINGACGGINRCTAGGAENQTDDGQVYRWTCAGTAGTANWSCPGTADTDTWQCTNGDLVVDCNRSAPPIADDCSASVLATNASCSHDAREVCIERDGDWTPPRPARPRTCRERCRNVLNNHTHSCTAEVGSTCTYKQHTSAACTNHKTAVCRPYSAAAGYCTVRGWEEDEEDEED